MIEYPTGIPGKRPNTVAHLTFSIKLSDRYISNGIKSRKPVKQCRMHTHTSKKSY